jgi:hypothetical protein
MREAKQHCARHAGCTAGHGIAHRPLCSSLRRRGESPGRLPAAAAAAEVAALLLAAGTSVEPLRWRCSRPTWCRCRGKGGARADEETYHQNCDTLCACCHDP